MQMEFITKNKKKQMTEEHAPLPPPPPLLPHDVLLFFDTYHDKSHYSAMVLLRRLLTTYPSFITIEWMQESRRFEIRYLRTLLTRAMRENHLFSGVIFTSFERGLKHAGFKVIRSTHMHQVKIWCKK
jgi:hypothetical protein